jgi:AcrR family transcriptional regulator
MRMSAHSLMEYHIPVAQRSPVMAPEERRAAIIEATIPLLLRDGMQVRTREIASAAGIAEGTVFRVFEDKESLLAATVEAVCDPRAMEEEIGAIDTSRPLEEQVTRAIAILQQKFVDVQQLLAAAGPRVPVPQPSTFPALTTLLTPFAAELVFTPERAASTIAALVVAMSLPRILSGAPLSPAEIARIALHGVSA